MEICQKIDVFPKIHIVKTLFLLTSPLAIKCHKVTYNIQKTRMTYLSTEKKYEHFCMTVFFPKNLIHPKGSQKKILSYKSFSYFFSADR